MPKATWNGELLAQSDDCIVVEGNQYFPKDAVNMELMRPSDSHTFCGWKGTASYYDVVVDGKVNKDAAWYYPDPMDDATHVKDRVAFWRGVQVEV